MGGSIFINYRRGDQPGFAGRLFDRLEKEFKPEQLFIDVDSIAPGHDFVRVLEDQVGKCDVLLAIIGKDWLDSRDEAGMRRLESPNDFVRIEIESALKLGKRVIPVLINDAHMPASDNLPDSIKALVRRNAVRLTHERFKSDVQGLVRALQMALVEAESARRHEAKSTLKSTVLNPNAEIHEAVPSDLNRRLHASVGVVTGGLLGIATFLGLALLIRYVSGSNLGYWLGGEAERVIPVAIGFCLLGAWIGAMIVKELRV